MDQGFRIAREPRSSSSHWVNFFSGYWEGFLTNWLLTQLCDCGRKAWVQFWPPTKLPRLLNGVGCSHVLSYLPSLSVELNQIGISVLANGLWSNTPFCYLFHMEGVEDQTPCYTKTAGW